MSATVARLNWGCGPHAAPGWINSDVRDAAGVDLCGDIRDGLALPSDGLDYAVAIHALQDVPYLDVRGVLRELRRVLRPGGVLRLGVPDLDRAIAAYLRGDHGYFYVPDDEVRTLGGKLAVQLVWYSSVRTPFTYDFIEELLRAAGFRDVVRCRYRETASVHSEIVALDNRERETLFVEAIK